MECFIEQLDAAKMSQKMHAQIRQVTVSARKKNTGITTSIDDIDGNIVMEQDRWHEYISEMYGNNRGDIQWINWTPIVGGGRF